MENGASGVPVTAGRSRRSASDVKGTLEAAARALGTGMARRTPGVRGRAGTRWAREGRARVLAARASGPAGGEARTAGRGAAAGRGTPASLSGVDRGGSAAADPAGPAPRRGGSLRSLDELER